MADLRRSNRKRHKTVPIEDSSSSGEETNAQKTTPRSSERLQKRQSCEFRLPTREEIWEKITPTKSPGKYDHLRPRKLVNNFTKENNRYNYDPNETSGEESMEDFIVDDDELEEDSSSEEEEVKTQNTPCRIKGRHRRFHSVPDSDASSSSEEDLSSHDPSHDSAMEDDDVNLECDRHSNKRVNVSCQKKQEDEDSDSNDETGNDRMKSKLVTRKSRNRSIIESDNYDEFDEKDIKKVKRIMKKKDNVQNSDRSETDELSRKQKGLKAPVTESDEIDSGGGSGEDSENEDVLFATRRVANHKRSFIESDDDNDENEHLNADHSARPVEKVHVNGDMAVMTTCHTSKKDCAKSNGVTHNQDKTDPNPLVKIEKEETDIQTDSTEMKVNPEQNLRIKMEKADDGFPDTDIKVEICGSEIVKSENDNGSISIFCTSNEVDKNSESESSDSEDDGSHDSEDEGSHDSDDDGSHDSEDEGSHDSDDDGSHGSEDEGLCESDDEFDEEVCSGRVRIGMLRKKQRTKIIIEQLRQDRERKLLRQNKKS